MKIFSNSLQIFLFITALSGLFSCQKDSNNSSEKKKMEDLIISSDFDYKTSSEVSISIKAYDNINQPLKRVKFQIFTAEPDSGGKLMVTGATNESGVFETDYNIPTYLKKVFLKTDYLGLPNLLEVPVDNGKIAHIYGGSTKVKNNKEGSVPMIFKNSLFTIKTLGSFNSNGKPNYLEPTNGIVDATLLNDINATLPERVNITTKKPAYFASTNEHNLSLTEECDVWVTFVHEGANWKNVLGFYTYNKNTPPTSVNNIGEVTIIFPNVSLTGSGGALNPGNRVFIGTFPPNTEVGWVLFSNGFQNGKITTGNYPIFSDDLLNPETNSAQKQHVVFLNDLGRQTFLLGFEDWIRNQSNCDNDFNDCVFYVTANPHRAVDQTHIPLPDYTSPDADGDKIPDNFDDYPSDASKAFNNYYPSENTYGSLAFEDLWPQTGDYDFNDMVIGYNFNQITNGENKAIEVKASLVLRAFGASYENGFGMELPISPSLIQSVTGIELSNGTYINVDSKNLETGQNKAVVIAFDNAYRLMPAPGIGIGVNTEAEAPYVTPDTLNIDIKLSFPTTLSTIGTPPYNPFIIVNKNRGIEIHLPDQSPTNKADLSLLGTERDNSIPANGRYYKTSNNLPWGLNIVDTYDYPWEKEEILQAHLKFASWAESNGTIYYDWFKNLTSYRDISKIYVKP